MLKSPYGVLRAFDNLSLRYGHWPLSAGRPRATVVLLGGRAEFMEKYLVTIEELSRRALDVFSFDWRGQGLSDRMLPDANKGHAESYAPYLSDLDLFLKRIVFPARRGSVMILAHSMGAHIALRHLSQSPDGVDRAIFSGPMIGIKLNPFSEMAARGISHAVHSMGYGHVGMPARLRKDSYARPFRVNRLTSDAGRFSAIRRMLADNPALEASNVTFGWLAATFDSIDALTSPGCAEQTVTPVLMVAAGRDQVVSNRAIYRFARRLPHHDVLTIHGAFHEILQEREVYRRQFWQAFDAFIR